MRAFVIAMADEADAVRPCLRAGDRLVVCGIGKVNAAAATQRVIDAGATEVCNAGLCGGFGGGVEIGGCYEVDRAVEYDFDLAAVNGTAVGTLDERDSPYLPAAPLGRLPAKTLATGDCFNDSGADDALIADVLRAELRDMEGAAVVHVCAKNGVPCHLLKCVSDVAGRGAMTGQYKANRTRCLEKLCSGCAVTFST